jgi:hypothetical protein
MEADLEGWRVAEQLNRMRELVSVRDDAARGHDPLFVRVDRAADESRVKPDIVRSNEEDAHRAMLAQDEVAGLGSKFKVQSSKFKGNGGSSRRRNYPSLNFELRTLNFELSPAIPEARRRQPL